MYYLHNQIPPTIPKSSEKLIQTRVTLYFMLKHLMSSSSLPWVCGGPRVVMRFLVGAVQKKVADAAESTGSAYLLTGVLWRCSPWDDTSKVREQEVQRAGGWQTCSLKRSEHHLCHAGFHIDWTQSFH